MKKVIDIKSKDNEKIKILRKLKMKKYRDKLDLFCVENLTIIHDALLSGQRIEFLFVSEELQKQNHPKLKFILDQVDCYYSIDSRLNKLFSSLESPSGICAVYKKPKFQTSFGNNVVYLNAIKDPGNLGTILRSCLAFGFKSLIIDEQCCDIFNPKTINSSKEAIFKLDILRDNDFGIIKSVKNKYRIIATNVCDGEDLKTVKRTGKYFIVFGNEASGVSEEILNLADSTVSIKMRGDIESLNVAAAAAIVLYELAKSE